MKGHKIRPRARTGILAGAAATALLAFPGIANAAVTSSVAGGALTVASDADDAIAITCDTNQVKVNGANPDTGAWACDAVTSILVNGGPGANAIDLTGVTVAAFPAIGAITVNGGAGNDTVEGSQHPDRIIGDQGADTARGNIGNDTLVWNPGDGSDVNEGGPGSDTIEVNGGNGPEQFTVKPSTTPGRIQFDRVNPLPFSLDIGTAERLDLNANGGDDTLTTDVGTGAFVIDADGGDGNDTLDGGDAPDLLSGGDGDDRLIGDDNPAGTRDVSRGGNGDDTMVWNPGDGSDVNDGGAGNDIVEVNGGGGPEQFTVKPSATAGRIAFDRVNPAPFNIDIGTSERLDLNANGGDDTLTTDGGTGAFVIDADGGAGNDTLDGGDAPDLLSGGDGDDRLIGDDNPAGTRDISRGDAGNDTMVWNPGDGSDVNEGGAGIDTVEVNGGGGAEQFTVKPSATPGRVAFDRVSPAPFNIDVGTSERLDLNANGGDDEITGAKGLAALGFSADLDGGDGNDTITGTDAADLVSGGAGNDEINTRDKAEDRVECDSGRDRAKVDKRDLVRGCERVIGGGLRVRIAGKALKTAKGAAALRLKCVGTERCSGTVRLQRGKKTLGRAKFSINRTKTVRVKLNTTGRRALAKAPAKGLKVAVRIDARDTEGNGWRTSEKRTLKR